MTNEELYAPIRGKYEELKVVLKGNDLERIIALTLEVHGMVHPARVSGLKEKTISDYVLDYMRCENHKEILVPRMNSEINLDYAGTDKVPMCWQFWHTYRIEDLVTNYLMGDTKEILNEDWCKKLNISIQDTGNALEDEEAVAFGKAMNEKALEEYAITVGKNTRKIVKGLTLAQLKKKASKEQLQRIMDAGGLTTDKRSKWLLEYWGSLTVAEMILTPLTDHHMMHLPPCLDHLPIVEK